MYIIHLMTSAPPIISLREREIKCAGFTKQSLFLNSGFWSVLLCYSVQAPISQMMANLVNETQIVKSVTSLQNLRAASQDGTHPAAFLV